MKKVGILFCGIISLGVLVGCGNTKTLTCTQTSDEGAEGNFIAEFKDDQLVSGELKAKMTLTEDQEAYFDILKESFESTVETMKTFEGVTVETNDNGKNEIEIVATFDYDQLNDDAKDELNVTTSSYDEVKKAYEDMDFVCE